jgi:hypothetical protein
VTAPTEPAAPEDEYGYIRDWLGMPGAMADSRSTWRRTDDLPDISGWEDWTDRPAPH